MQSYESFLKSKTISAPSVGIEVGDSLMHASFFPFQRDLTRWSLKKGRGAIFANTGLGKTLMQLVWAERAAKRSLIVAPLAVAKQTVREAEKWGLKVTYCRSQEDAAITGISITNYEMLGKFRLSQFGAVVLDESGILKNFAGKTRTRLIESCCSIPMRLCCTATPAPNDIAELANHAEFLGVMTRTEMLATFFVHDDSGWRLKRHAREPFYRWLASWGMFVSQPSDLGYSNEGYELPSLEIIPVYVESDWKPEGMLFAAKVKGLTERASLRQATMQARVERAVEIVSSEPNEQWLLWCGLNPESDALAKGLPNATTARGADSLDHKEESLLGFGQGEIKQLITKPKIAGHGLNLQRCARMIFVGIDDSYESYFQCIRRCWRFGQTRPVKVYIVLSEGEKVIYDNVLRKEREALELQRELVKHIAEYEKAEIAARQNQKSYHPALTMQLPEWIGANHASR